MRARVLDSGQLFGGKAGDRVSVSRELYGDRSALGVDRRGSHSVLHGPHLQPLCISIATHDPIWGRGGGFHHRA